MCVLHTFGRPLGWNPHIHNDKKDIMAREARYC
ncbi:transposase [Enterocloster clostridioformis]